MSITRIKPNLFHRYHHDAMHPLGTLVSFPLMTLSQTIAGHPEDHSFLLVSPNTVAIYDHFKETNDLANVRGLFLPVGRKQFCMMQILPITSLYVKNSEW